MFAILGLVLYVVLLLVAVVLRMVIQKRRTGDSGLRLVRLREMAGTSELAAEVLLVVAAILGIAAPVAELVGLDPLFFNPWLRAAGVVICLIGIALMFASQLSMGDQWRIGVDRLERTGLVTTGAFTIVRNPIFSTMILASFGLALAVPNWVSIVGLLSLVVAIQLQVRSVEEPHLRHIHGAAYETYQAAVGRFVPRRRRPEQGR